MSGNKKFICKDCGKGFSRSGHLAEHEDWFHNGHLYRCPACSVIFKLPRKMTTHFEMKHHNKNTCLYCQKQFNSNKDMFNKEHILNCLMVTDAQQQHQPEKINKPIEMTVPKDDDFKPDLAEYPDDIKDEVKNYWKLIKTSKSIHDPLDHSYNFRWNKFNGNFMDMLSVVYNNEKEAFRIDGALGAVLKNRESGARKYWYACQNNFTLLDKPVLVKNSDDVKQLVERLKNIDVEEKFSRPDTKWGLEVITNVEFFVTPQKNFVVGCKDFNLPETISHQRSNILGMMRDNQHNKINDNLCFFRCLAQCLSGNFEDKDLVFKLFVKYCEKKNIKAIVDLFEGVPYTDLEMLEDLFEVDIQVFHVDLSSKKAVCWKTSIRKYDNLLNLDVSITAKGLSHYSLITNLDQYAKRYVCLMCNRLFRKIELLNYHIKKHCHKGVTKHKFPGGVFQVKKTVFEQIEEELDISIPKMNKFCPFIAAYDFEALLIKKSYSTSEKQHFISQHQPVSCAVHTNIPGFDPICFVNNNPDELINQLLQHLESIADKQSEILLEKYKSVFEALEVKIKEVEVCIEDLKNREKDFRREKGHVNKILKIKAKLLRYCMQLTCLGFNAGKYDINLIKSQLFPKLVEKARYDPNIPWPKAILKNGSYLCLTTNNLKFLDATVYVAPGFSLDAFMRAYKATMTKANFPYEYLDNFDKLLETNLPPKEAFYSKLKDEPISDEDYEKCKTYWFENKMQTLKDYLIFYNLRDVVPFLEASCTMNQLYWEQFGIDIFREAMSLPGVTERYLFNNIPETKFALFAEQSKNLYYELKSSMRGGLSMVMTRLAIKDETFIRNNPEKPVKTIIGLDFNALYLWAQAMPMPTGHFDYWVSKDNKFQKISTSKPISVEWLEQESGKLGEFIQHKGNGSEKCIGPRSLPVDGYCAKTKTMYEFYGCFWHCHDCLLGQRNKDKDPDEARKWINEKEIYIKSLGYNLITIWECEWHNKKAENYADTRKFLTKKWVSKAEMEKAILDGSVFGFAKVDISTPEYLKAQYADFPPIIKHAEISRKDIGEFMKAFAEKTDQLRHPRKNLISSYFGKQIIISTEMVKFLVEHGLKLEKIYEVIQYDKTRPFEAFRDKVTKHRQDGDKDPALAMIADTFKLLGNTGYGKTLTNKENHINVFYGDYEKAAESSLSPYIKKIKFISPNCYEIHMFKQEIVMDLPIVVGLSVYNWAKIRMLQFFYDVLQKYFDPADYQCLQTDTDSIYLTLSAPNLEDIVKQELKDEFMKIYPEWFVTSKETKRTPGLLKKEYEGTAMCCLAAKTYMAVNHVTGEKKISSKGIMKKPNKLTFSQYMQVLENKKEISGTNIGFRMQSDNKMWTYLQQKQGLPYLYVKRIVLPDGISTIPLEI